MTPLSLLITKAGLTPITLAKAIKVSPATVYNMMAGKRVKTQTFFAAARALRVDVVEIAPHLAPTLKVIRKLTGR